MNCPKCGHVIEAENVKFCPKCGAKIEEAPVEEAKEEVKETVEEVKEDNPYGPSFATQTPYNVNNTPEKKSKTPLIVGIIAVVLVVALIFGLVMSGFFSGLSGLFTGGTKTSKVVFYQSKDEIHMIKDVTAAEDKIKDFEVAEGEEDENSLIGVDKSQKHFYYYSDYDYEKGEGTACVIPIAKISDKADKNEKAAVEIADDVSSFQIVDGGKAVYIVDEDELYYFDGKESHKIDDEVDYIFAYDNMVVYEKYDEDDETYSLNYAKYSSKPQAEEIDDDIDYVSSYDPEFIIYSKDGDDGKYDIYVGSAEKGCEKFAKEATLFDYDVKEKTIWYGEESDTELTLEEFFEDDLDGAESVSMSEFMKEADADEIFGDYDFTASEIRETMEMFEEYYDPDEKLKEETGKDYYELISGYDEDDEYCYYYYCATDDTFWKISYDEYRKAHDAEETYEEFVEEWEEAKDDDLGASFYDLRYYKNGKSKKVAENVIYASAQNDVCYYSHISDDGFKKVSLKEAYKSYLDGDYNAITDFSNYVDYFGVSYSISGNDGQLLELDCDLEDFANIYISKDREKAYAIINEDDDADGYRIAEYTNKNGTFELTEKEVAENGMYLGQRGDYVYYLDNYDSEDGVGDLYARKGSKSELVSKKVTSETNLYAFDDTVYGFSSLESYDEADFYRFKDGDKDKIESDVNPYGVYGLGDEMFVFLKDNTLYYTNGTDKPVKLAKKVDYVETVSSVDFITIWN